MKLLAYPEAMHAAVEAGFPPGALTDAGVRALWRIDSPTLDETNLFIVSPVEPDLSHLVEQAGWQTGSMWQTRDYSPVLDGVRVGSRYAFRLRGNPVHSARSDPTMQTKPRAHVSVKHQEGWLLDRAARNGFMVPDGPLDEALLKTVDRGVMRFGKRPGHRVTLAHATFEGVLEVTDLELFRHVLTFGLGRGKAYGLGLLTIAALPSGPQP